MHDRYAEYKDCISPSFGKIPAHWREIRTGFLFDFGRGMSISRSDMSDDGKVPCIHYGDIHGKYGFEINPMMADIGYLPQEALDTFKQAVIGYGDFLFVGTSEDIDGSGNFTYVNTNCKAIAGSDTIILRPIKPIKHRYMAYLFDSDSYREQIRALVYGIKVFHPTQSIIKNAWCILPPIHEQEKIITHLDYQTKQIDKIVDSLDTQRKKLTRYKRDLIAECVTKGLNKAAPMRPSDEDWIGDVPEHWKIVPLRAFLKSNNKKNPGGLPLLSVERERGVVNRETDGSPDNYNRIPDDLSNYKMVNEGQFVMNKMKAWQGSYGVAPCDGIVSPAYHVYDLVFENKAFFNYAIRSKCYVVFFGRDSYGIRTDQWDFKAECIKHIPFVVPSLEEQKEIVNYLSKQVSRINSLQENITSQIQKLKDYRRILIHDAVTGKIKI